MNEIIYERHRMTNPLLPFIFHTDIKTAHVGSVANWHENTEFLYCLEGEGSATCDADILTMKEGDMVIINARCLHAVTTADRVKYHCLIIDNSFFKENGIDIDNIRFDEVIHDDKAGDLIKNIAKHAECARDSLSVAETRLCLLEFVCHICRHYPKLQHTESDKISKGYAAVLDAIEYINAHFKEKLTLDEISSRAGYSRYHFARLFKDNTGSTVTLHINTRRCENAAFLLRETEKSIRHVSLECGFESPSYFAKAFKKIYGLLPTEYRESFLKR